MLDSNNGYKVNYWLNPSPIPIILKKVNPPTKSKNFYVCKKYAIINDTI